MLQLFFGEQHKKFWENQYFDIFTFWFVYGLNKGDIMCSFVRLLGAAGCILEMLTEQGRFASSLYAKLG